MYRYRMTIEANVCFDVVAGTEEEAVAKARAIASAHIDGLDVIDSGNSGMRVYMDAGSEPAVEDQSAEKPKTGIRRQQGK